MQTFAKWIALLCLLMTLGSAAAVVAHHHAGRSESGQCAVCAAVHTPAAMAAAHIPSRAVACAAVIAAPRQELQSRLITFALLVRPPPAA